MKEWKEWKVVGGSYAMDYGDGPGWYAACYFNTTTPGAASWDELRAYRDKHGTTSWGAGPFKTQTEAYAWIHEKDQELGRSPFDHTQTMEISSVRDCTQEEVDSQNRWRADNRAAFQDDIDKLEEWERTHEE